MIHVFLTSALVKGDWSASRPGRVTPGERAPGTHWIRGWVGLRIGLGYIEKRKFLTLPGLKLRPHCLSARSQSLYRLSYPGSYVECNILYKEDGLILIICACCLWEMVLNVGLEVSFGNMQESKGIREKAREVNIMKAYITNSETYRWNINGCYIRLMSFGKWRSVLWYVQVVNRVS
jgi:hypothetical protein